MKYNDLPVNQDKYIGPSHQQFCNRYRSLGNGTVEVQNIYRYAKPGKTVVMTAEEFDKKFGK